LFLVTYTYGKMPFPGLTVIQFNGIANALDKVPKTVVKHRTHPPEDVPKDIREEFETNTDPQPNAKWHQDKFSRHQQKTYSPILKKVCGSKHITSVEVLDGKAKEKCGEKEGVIFDRVGGTGGDQTTKSVHLSLDD
jgi:hypothetical protein